MYVDVADHVEIGRERRHDGVVLLVGGYLGHVQDNVREDDTAAEHVADDIVGTQRGYHLEKAAADRGEHAEEHGQEFAAVLRGAAFHLEQAKERNDDVGRVLAEEQDLHRAGLVVEHGVVDGEEEIVRDVQEQKPELDGDKDHRRDTQDRGVLDALAQVIKRVAQPEVGRDCRGTVIDGGAAEKEGGLFWKLCGKQPPKGVVEAEQDDPEDEPYERAVPHVLLVPHFAELREGNQQDQGACDCHE